MRAPLTRASAELGTAAVSRLPNAFRYFGALGGDESSGVETGYLTQRRRCGHWIASGRLHSQPAQEEVVGGRGVEVDAYGAVWGQDFPGPQQDVGIGIPGVGQHWVDKALGFPKPRSGVTEQLKAMAGASGDKIKEDECAASF